MTVKSSNPIAQPVSTDEIYLHDHQQVVDSGGREQVDAISQPPLNGAFPSRDNSDDEYWTVCCWLPCCLCGYSEISCPQKQADCCRVSCCSCSMKCMDFYEGGAASSNTYFFYCPNGNSNNYNNSCCYCFDCGNCGDWFSSIIKSCNNIPCFCECCNAVVSTVFYAVSGVSHCSLSLFCDD